MKNKREAQPWQELERGTNEIDTIINIIKRCRYVLKLIDKKSDIKCYVMVDVEHTLSKQSYYLDLPDKLHEYFVKHYTDKLERALKELENYQIIKN